MPAILTSFLVVQPVVSRFMLKIISEFVDGLDSLKYLEILSKDQGEKQSDHFNHRKSRQIASHLVRFFFILASFYFI